MHFLTLQGAKVVFNGFNGELTKREVPGHHMALKVGHLHKRNGVNGPEADFHRLFSSIFYDKREMMGAISCLTSALLGKKENIQLWLGYQAHFDPKYILTITQK